jgi:hypothetical protein
VLLNGSIVNALKPFERFAKVRVCHSLRVAVRKPFSEPRASASGAGNRGYANFCNLVL